jgi:hypothetical protein
MGNLLEFAIGLQASEFLNNLEVSREALLAFTAAFETLRNVGEHTWAAIEQGAELRGLASATGENVAMLYSFQQGLSAVGGQFNSMMFLQVEKALSGINDQGLRTDILFSRIGLNIGKLRAEDPAQAIVEIAAALGHVNRTAGAGIAESIFGRFQAEDILKMSRNMDVFQRGFSASSGTAALLDKFSKTFEEVKLDWQIVLNDVDGIWIAIAGRIAPEMEKIFKNVDSHIKNFGPAIAQALQTGQMEDLFKAAFAAAWEQFRNYGEASAAAVAIFLGDTLTTVFTTIFSDFVSTLGASIANAADIAYAKSLQKKDAENAQGLQHTLAKFEDDQTKNGWNPETWGHLGNNPAQARGNLRRMINEAQTDEKTQGDTIMALSGMTMETMRENFSDAFIKSGGAIANGVHDGTVAFEKILANASRSAGSQFVLMIENLAKNIVGDNSNSSNAAGAGPAMPNLTAGGWKPEFTSLEKMGFIMTPKHSTRHFQLSLASDVKEIVSILKDHRRSFSPPMDMRSINQIYNVNTLDFMHNGL